jgi:Uma2 family endonuclease
MSNLVPAGEIVAENVSVEDFLVNYIGTETRYEWVKGFVIQLAPNSLQHKESVNDLKELLSNYFSVKPIGEVYQEKGVKLLPHAIRVPDLAIVLDRFPESVKTSTLSQIPAICIEVISPNSHERDTSDKKDDYQQWGVSEYWLIDPLTSSATFYRLQDGVYTPASLDTQDNFQTPLLPKLKIHVPTLWQEALPNLVEIVDMVQTMLAEE